MNGGIFEDVKRWEYERAGTKFLVPASYSYSPLMQSILFPGRNLIDS